MSSMDATPDLNANFLQRPLAHRALHDVQNGRPENSRAAIRAAISAGYGIEIDLQLSADGQAMVFHDDHLDRLAHGEGLLRLHSAARLQQTRLRGGDETIPTLRQILDLVQGQTPLLIELKDQDGAMGDKIGRLEAATATALSDYHGPVAVMSFNPHSVLAMADLAPDIARGLTTSAFDAAHWPELPDRTRDRLRNIPDLIASGASFISHEVTDLNRPRVTEIKAQGLPVLCWTVRSPTQEAQARKVADNITFEGYAAAKPA